MSLYNANIRTRIIDPQFDRKSFKTEYRLDGVNSVYLSNMRLINMGIISNPVGNPSFCNPLLGVFCIKSIQLFDGNKMLDQQLEASIYKAFQTYNTTNDENMSVEPFLTRTTHAYTCSGIQDVQTNKPKLGDIQVQQLYGELVGTNGQLGPEGTKAWFSLKEFLPFLSSSLYLPTKVYKNLRIVINWKSPAELGLEVVVDQIRNYETMTESSIVVDEVNEGPGKDAMVKNYKGVVFKAIERDSARVEAITGLAADEVRAQSTSLLVNGFNNKSVERLLIVQTPTESATWIDGNALLGGANQISVAQHKSTIQVRVNGANRIPRDGFTRKNQRLAALTDSYGPCTIVPSTNYIEVIDMAQFLSDGQGTQADVDQRNVQGLKAQFDYMCCEVRGPVQELVINYGRSGVAGNANLNQALTINLFGEVNKAVAVANDGSYVIQYL